MNDMIIDKLSMFSEVLGWTLIHSLWQIVVVAIALKIVLHLVPQRNAQIKYNLSLVALLAIAIWTIATFSHQIQAVNTNYSVSLEEILTAVSTEDVFIINNAAGVDSFINTISKQLDVYLPLLSTVWLLGIGFLLIRLLLNYNQLNRLDQQQVKLPSVEWLDRLDHFCRQLEITREVKLLLSERISEPITFRHFCPVILLPVSMMTGLSAAQIETLLLHELAHIRRYDYLINLFQSVLEILFFFHPAVWWISRIVREEREHCCDDLVLQYQQHPMLYAEALLQIQANHYSLKTNLAMSAKGNHKPFTTRIQRLFGKYPTPNSITRGTLLVVLILGALSVFAFSIPTEKVDTPQDIISVPIDTTPVQDAVIITTNNAEAREIHLITDKSFHEHKDTERLLEENGIKLDPNDIKTIKIQPLEDIEKPHSIAKRKQDMEDLFGDDVVKLVEVIKDGEKGRVDTFITFELKERPIKLKPIILEEPLEQNVIPMESAKEGEVVFQSVDLSRDTIDKPEKVKIHLHGDKRLTDKTPLTIVDGEERNDIHEIDPNHIKSITVLKGEAALEKYGEKGRDGVVEIITKESKKGQTQSIDKNAKNKSAIKGIVESTGEKPLLIVDGKAFNRDLNTIDADDIESVHVIKGKGALEKYGQKGKSGVVEVITKNGNFSNKKVTKEDLESDLVIVGTVKDQTLTTPLYIVDGEEFEQGFDGIDPDNIEFINVIKGKAAFEKYGEKGKDGVIEVRTKNKKKAKKEKVKMNRKLEKMAEISPSPAMESSSKASFNDIFKVFPNPSDDIIRIQGELKQDTKIKIEIWDMKGALVQKLVDGTFKGGINTEWDASKATSGTYIVKITMNGEVSSQKVVVK